uniref:Lytic murein transglycosylase n=1 Tax=Hydrogenovibrio crunogenus (strain DSM 25203 / XCL-2) TaxID=317025 RepID=Q31IC9_HYDCU
MTPKFYRHFFMLFTAFSILIGPKAYAYTPPPQSESDFQTWLVEFKKSAYEQGISKTTLKKAFKDVHLNQRVLELDRRQPEFTRTFWQYFNRAVTDWRIQTGQELYEKYRPQLREVTRKYGVPGRFLIAFWGMETNFGGYTGNTPIIESLATLSYDPRRSEFFQKELMAALKIIQEGNIKPEQMKGSWAGAMGQCQFMPSNYLKYAVDADDSGKRDLWNSLDDVFHSMGNFLNTLGWQKQENWGREVTLPEGFDLALADGKTERPLQEWKDMGLTLADGRELPVEDMKAKLLLPYDYRGPVFLVFHNFDVIKRWNRSDSYALAVGHLADRIVGRAPLSKEAPEDDKSLDRQQMIEMQERLSMAGIDVGKTDGIAGNKTRAAIRQYQTQKGLPADGYPSFRMLQILRQNQS